MYFKTFKKVILSMYILILTVKIIKPQFPTLDTTIAEFPAQCFEHNLKTAFNLALNFSGWCILIFFKSKASGTIYKHDMSHLLFEGGGGRLESVFWIVYWLPTTLLKIWGISWAIPISSVTSNFPPFLCDTSDIYQ